MLEHVFMSLSNLPSRSISHCALVNWILRLENKNIFMVIYRHRRVIFICIIPQSQPPEMTTCFNSPTLLSAQYTSWLTCSPGISDLLPTWHKPQSSRVARYWDQSLSSRLQLAITELGFRPGSVSMTYLFRPWWPWAWAVNNWSRALRSNAHDQG